MKSDRSIEAIHEIARSNSNYGNHFVQFGVFSWIVFVVQQPARVVLL